MAEKGEWLGNILNSFKKVEVPIGAELFYEMVRRWKKQNEVNLKQGGSSHFHTNTILILAYLTAVTSAHFTFYTCRES